MLIFGLFLSWVIPIAQSKYKLNKSSAIIIFMLIVTTIIGYPLNQRKQLPKEYSEVIKFVEEHTDSNSIILVNPKLTEFKFYSKRAVIVDTKNSSPDKDPEGGWKECMTLQIIFLCIHLIQEKILKLVTSPLIKKK